MKRVMYKVIQPAEGWQRVQPMPKEDQVLTARVWKVLPSPDDDDVSYVTVWLDIIG
jgi:hypothetical protein